MFEDGIVQINTNRQVRKFRTDFFVPVLPGSQVWGLLKSGEKKPDRGISILIIPEEAHAQGRSTPIPGY